MSYQQKIKQKMPTFINLRGSIYDFTHTITEETKRKQNTTQSCQRFDF